MVEDPSGLFGFVRGVIETALDWFADGSTDSRRADTPFRYPESLYHQRSPQDPSL